MQAFINIHEKLIRAKQNIVDLEGEIVRFFEKSDYPVIPNDEGEALTKAIEYHKNLAIPPRFGVLAGEVIHHLRSCFDHIAWHFSTGPVEDPRRIEFPVFEETLNHARRRSFERKIEGIENPRVRRLIEALQPYNASDPIDDPLWIIHDFDIVDKHKSLVVCFAAPVVFFRPSAQHAVESYRQAHPELKLPKIARHFYEDSLVLPRVAFRDFGRRATEGVIPGLTNLFNYTVGTMEKFEVY